MRRSAAKRRWISCLCLFLIYIPLYFIKQRIDNTAAREIV